VLSSRVSAVLAAVAVCAGCSSPSPAPRDDRGKVREVVQAFGAGLVQFHYTTEAPAVFIGKCAPAHWAAVKWSTPVTTKLSQERPDRAEAEVLANATTAIKLDYWRFIHASEDQDPAQIAQTSDHATALTVTVPRGEYVRVDGYASC
jgi:hypothetical protein